MTTPLKFCYFFTSLRSSNGNYVSENYKIKVYSAELKDSVWEMEKELDNNINLPLHHNANSCFSENGRQFYFTRCESYSDCKIMVSEYENGTWNKPKILNINTINKITTHPMICKIENKEYLFFASNREGSYGKLDIWFAEKETLTRFKKPINAGKKVNSIDNEITPFYDVKNRTLYFSSNWHKGLGGYDIFKSRGRSLNRLGLPQNLGSPINTSWNDMYYFIDTLNKINYLASNRKEKKSNNNSTCCNDIFSVKFPEPKKIEDLSKEIITLEDLNKYLPVTLYFHNDCPNPRSIDTTTNLNYLTTFDDYLNLKPKYNIEYSKGLTGYKEEIAKLDIQDFFKDYVEKGVKDLDLFTNLLFIELEKGTDVEITVKGFASPLAKTDYNVKLTGRRISSLINYLNEFDNGKFKPYLNGTATNKGKLTFVRIPFGEHRANELVSDNVNDKRNSVYSKSAGLERKIEIVSVNLANDTTEKAKYKVDKYIINKGKVKKGSLIDVEFEITNTGKIPLEFKDIKASCGCTLIEMTEIPLESNKSRTLKATINTNQFVGKQTKIITLFTNTKPSIPAFLAATGYFKFKAIVCSIVLLLQLFRFSKSIDPSDFNKLQQESIQGLIVTTSL